MGLVMKVRPLTWSLPIEGAGSAMFFEAEGVRRERTGVHAVVRISIEDEMLTYSAINCDKDEDRTRLANAALKRIPAFIRPALENGNVKTVLDAFCRDLWRRHIDESGFRGELMAGDPDIGPPRQLAGPYVLEGGGTLIYGPPGRGKSTVALAAAVSLDAGCAKVWPVRAAARTMYVNIERSPDSMRHRLARTNAALGLDPKRPLPFLNARGRPLVDIEDGIAQDIEEHGVEVLIVDSISRAGAGDLNKPDAANRIVDTLNGLCPTWVALAHTPRLDDTHVYGSVHFEAGEDVGVRLVSSTSGDGAVTGVGLQVTKANDMRKPPLACYALTWDDGGLTDIRPARRREFPELEGGAMSIGDEIAELLLMTGALSATEIAAEIGRPRQNVSEKLNSDPRFVRVRRDGKSVLFGVRGEA